MTIRLEMIEALSRSKTVLEDSTSLVINFLQSKINPDGGFKGRGEQSDLYYTFFGLEALIALGSSLPRDNISDYLKESMKTKPKDLVHLASLIRCCVNLTNDRIEGKLCDSFIKDIECYRCKDGGYANTTNVDKGTVYGCFFALTAYQDLELDLPDSALTVECIQNLCNSDGSFSNDSIIHIGSTNATAGAVIILRHLNQPINQNTTGWLLEQCISSGGFLAMPNAPIPDLLSTATALHALARTGYEISTIKEKCLDYIDSLWSGEGGFYGNWTDKVLDCEYTYYGLLALGHLC
ncbi:MAG: prenyltransferase/squalene oxidase repeat-containing protein [Planctomycetota bacterium]